VVRRAFTLIELLVVIAIIAVLAAILFPVFAQAKAAAKRTGAISNTKQVTLAAMMYMEDHDGDILPRYDACGVPGGPNFPTDRTRVWPALLLPYTRSEQIYLDPAASHSRYGGIWMDLPEENLWGRGWISIGKNTSIMGWYLATDDPVCPGIFPRTGLHGLQQPSRSVFFMTSNSGPTTEGYKGYLADNAWKNQLPSPDLVGLSDRHNGGTVLSFFDGHAKWYRTEAILGDPDAPPRCEDTTFETGRWWLDVNPARLKFNIQDTCIPNP
jgi:prepilin-type N-terminal cleavage/methylation domain-containing protein/prepilin-type processing-associated H-X9-DG protein